MKSSARISVCLPNFNHAKYLSGAIEAIWAQSLRPFEVIVVDDASDDDSVKIIEDLCIRFPDTRLIKNSVNQGCCRSTNRAIEAATGDYIFATAADDLVLPGYFQRTVLGLEEYPRAGVCVTGVKYIDSGGVEINPRSPFLRAIKRVLGGNRRCHFLAPKAVLARLRWRPWFLHGGPSPLYRRSVIIEAGGLHEELGPYTDWFNVHFAALKYGLVYVPEALVAFRIATGGFGESTARSPKTAIEKLNKVLGLMGAATYKGVFPEKFVRQRESDFAYYSLAGSLNYSKRNFDWGVKTLMPAKSFSDRVILGLISLLHKTEKAALLLYCRKKLGKIDWENTGLEGGSADDQ